MQELKASYQDKELQGFDFSGQNLIGANFFRADIRGVKFKNCDLSHASFEGAKAGISTSWKIRLYLITTSLCLLAGLISGYSGALISNLFFGNSAGPTFGIVSLTLSFIFLIAILFEGVGITLAILSELSAAALIAAMAIFPNDQAMLALDAQFTALSIAGYTAGLINIAAAISMAKLAKLFRYKNVLLSVSALGLLIGILFGVSEIPGYPISLIVGLLTIIIGYYTGQKTLLNTKKHRIIQQLARNIVGRGATTFQGAILTSANFSNSNLNNTDLRDGILLRTNWGQVQGLNSARLENTYLENIEIQKLVTTRNGQGKQYDNFSLRGLNLESVNLEGASLISSDLSESNLKGANLKGAKLVKSQLYHADLGDAENS